MTPTPLPLLRNLFASLRYQRQQARRQREAERRQSAQRFGCYSVMIGPWGGATNEVCRETVEAGRRMLAEQSAAGEVRP